MYNLFKTNSLLRLYLKMTLLYLALFFLFFCAEVIKEIYMREGIVSKSNMNHILLNSFVFSLIILVGTMGYFICVKVFSKKNKL